MKLFRAYLGCAALMAVTSASVVHAADQPPTGGVVALKAYAESLAGEQREAAEFLIAHLPDIDRENLTIDLFRENLEQAYFARTNYAWTKELPKELFFNDVLPYAVASETRDAHRKLLREMLHPLLTQADTLKDATAVAGNHIAELTGVRYDTTREKACQSPVESIRQGKASCTGLSILMVDALRAAGIPCRLAAIALWGTKEGNHTWVEVHDGTTWRKTGWAEGPDKWDGGWEIPRCAYCDPADPIHGVFASSYRNTGIEFPMIWEWRIRRRQGNNFSLSDLYAQERDEQGTLTRLEWRVQPIKMAGVDRTNHYLELAGGRKFPIPKGSACIAVKAYAEGSDERVAVPIRVFQGAKLLYEGNTADNSQDLNDYVRLISKPEPIRVEYQDAEGNWLSQETNCAVDEVTLVRIDV